MPGGFHVVRYYVPGVFFAGFQSVDLRLRDSKRHLDGMRCLIELFTGFDSTHSLGDLDPGFGVVGSACDDCRLPGCRFRIRESV